MKLGIKLPFNNQLHQGHPPSPSREKETQASGALFLWFFVFPGEEWADSLWTLLLIPRQSQRPGEWPTVNGAAHSLHPGEGLQRPPVSTSPSSYSSTGLKWRLCSSLPGCRVGTLISSSSAFSVSHSSASCLIHNLRKLGLKETHWDQLMSFSAHRQGLIPMG